MIRPAPLALAIATLFWATDAPAQECADTDTIAECWQKVVPSTLEAIEIEEVVASNVGLPTGDALGSAAKDFLTLLSAVLDSSSLGEQGETLTFDWNPDVPDVLPKVKVKLQTVVRRPEIYTPLQEAIGDATITAKLRDTLGDFDDVAINGSMAWVNVRFGHEFDPHRALYQELLGDLSVDPAVLLPMAELIQTLQARNISPFDTVTDGDEVVFSEIKDAAIRAELKRMVIEAARATADQITKSGLSYRARGLHQFDRLLNNQPQLFLSIDSSEPDSLVGPTVRGYKLTFERGLRNLNTFRAFAGTACSAGDPTACREKYAEYLQGAKTQRLLRDGNRISLALEYSVVDALKVELPELATPLTRNSSHSLIGSVTYGWLMRTGADGREGRVDVKGSYEDVSEDLDRKDRLVGSVVFTQKISDNLSIPLAIIYANHAKFLGDVDEKFSAHFGLLLKVPDL